MERSDAVLIQQASGAHSQLLSLTQNLHTEYCRRHGIDYWCFHGDPVDRAGRAPNWPRVKLMLQAVSAGYRHIIWLDADCLIVGDEDLRDAAPGSGLSMTWHDMTVFREAGLVGIYDHWCTGAVYAQVADPLAFENLFWAWWERSDEGHVWADQHALNLLIQEGKVPPPSEIDRRWHSVHPHFEVPDPVVRAWHGFGSVADRYRAMQEAIEEMTPAVRPAAGADTSQVSASQVLGEPFDSFQDRSDRFRRAKEAEDAGDQAEAEREYRAILAERPDEPEVLRELGQILAQKGELAEAERLLRLSVAYEPNFGGSWCILGAILGFQGRWREERECYDLALRFAPDMPAAHWNRALNRLKLGDYRGGFEEVRWGRISKHRRVRFPEETAWDGKAPVDTLLVWSDEGAGDVIMWSRFLRDLKARFPATKVVWEVHDGLVELMARQGLSDMLIKLQLDCGMPLDFDAHVGLADLPFFLDLSEPEQLGMTEPYLAPDPALVKRWRSHIDGPGLQVGVVWRGNPKHANDRNRSLTLDALRPVLTQRGATFYSLQLGTVVEGDHIRNLPIRSWHDTAAIIENLDLVVTVDTGVCHLAGAMGQRVITLLPLCGDWRWGVEGEETLWYPSMTLARQRRIGDWTDPVCEVAAAVAQLIEEAPIAVA